MMVQRIAASMCLHVDNNDLAYKPERKDLEVA